MFKEKKVFVKSLLFVLDAVIISFSFFVMFLARKFMPEIYPFDFLPSVHVLGPVMISLSEYFTVYLILMVLWMGFLRMNGMYSTLRVRPFPELVWNIIKSAFLVMVSFGTIVFILKLKYMSRFVFGGFILTSSILLLTERYVFLLISRHNIHHGFEQVRLLIVGTGERSTRLRDEINAHPEWGYLIVKVVDLEECLLSRGMDIKGCEVMSNSEDMRKILHQETIDQVIFEVPKSKLDSVENLIYACQEEGVDSAVGVDFFDITIPKIHLTDIDGIPLVTFENTFGKEWQLFVKRIMDVAISGAGIFLLSPLFLLVSILIKLTSPGKVFFTQKRVGLHGRIFTMYKFRSMDQDAEKKFEEIKTLNEMDGPVFKMKNDPRITPLGRILRKTSIDELPQLFNVLVGRLSLVGPRPPLPGEVDAYEPWHRKRLSMRPGITCLWQAHHRGENDFKKWVENDIQYINTWSLKLDSNILIRTIAIVLSGKGAF